MRLIGIDSVQHPQPRRQRAWERLSATVPDQVLEALTTECSLAEVPERAAALLRGEVRGRVVVDIDR